MPDDIKQIIDLAIFRELLERFYPFLEIEHLGFGS